MRRDAEPAGHLHRLLLAGEFVVTAEMQTSDSADPASIVGAAETLRGAADAVNCTDNSAAHTHVSALAASHLLVESGIEPVMQLVCRDRNRLALQADLLGAATLGVRNVMCMTGDDVSAGDHPEAKPIYDIDSIHLIRIARIMRDEGTYLSGRPLADAPSFLIGAVENPFAPPRDFRPMRLGTKIEAGAEFVQTQICFNLEAMRIFMARCGELGLLDQVWVIAGVFIPSSVRGARYLRDHVPGVDVPEPVIDRMESVPPERQKDEGIGLALDVVDAVRQIPGVSGIHLMTINHEEAIPRVVREAGLLPRPEPAPGPAASPGALSGNP